MRQHGDVTAGHLGDSGAHALCDEPFHVWVHGTIVLPNDVPAWFRFPGGSSNFCVEQVGFRNTLRRQNELLFLVGQITGEIVDTLREQPDASVLDLDVGEDRCLREIGLLRLRSLVRVRGERTDVNQGGNALVGSSPRDDTSAVRVADKDNRAAGPADRCFC
jgi:hypothetical protein